MPAQPLISRYAQAAGQWHRDITKLGYPQAYDQLLAALPPLPAEACILDAGAGTGALSQAWLKRQSDHNRLTLLDMSADMLDAARTSLATAPRVAFTCAPLGTPDIAARSVDLILSAHVIEHLDQPQSGLDWFAQLLRPGGRIALSVSKPHWCTALVRWRWGHHAYRPDAVRTMLARAGFSGIREVAFRKGPPSRTSRGYLAVRR